MYRFFAHMLTVFALVFASNASCLCWLAQMTETSGCHMAKEMKDCCCNHEAKLDGQAPRHSAAVLISTVALPDLNLVVSEIDPDFFVSSQSFFTTSSIRDRGGSLRSPPDLYVLHATFLI